MSSFSDIISALRPRKGDMTRLIPVKSKSEQDALLYNAYTAHPIDPSSNKPGKSLKLFHPYYRRVDPDPKKSDEFGTETTAEPLYEHVHLPTVRIQKWIETAQEHKKAKLESEIASKARARQSLTEHDDAPAFSLKRHMLPVDEPAPKKDFEHIPETKITNRGNTAWEDHFAPEDLTAQKKTQYTQEKVSQQNTGTYPTPPSQREITSRSAYHAPTDLYLEAERYSQNQRLAHEPFSQKNAFDAQMKESHLVYESQIPPPLVPHPLPVENTKILLNNTLTQPNDPVTTKLSENPHLPLTADAHDAPTRLTLEAPLPATPPLTAKAYTFPKRLSVSGIVDLDTEQPAIRANYQDLTKKLISSGTIDTAFLHRQSPAFPLNEPLQLGSTTVILSGERTAPDGRTVYCGETVGASKRSILLYEWHDGPSWETARAWKALAAITSPGEVRLHQLLRGSHSLAGRSSQPPHSDREYAYVESGWTMLSCGAPISALSDFLRPDTPIEVASTILHQLFGMYRSLAFQRVVHHFVRAESVFVSISPESGDILVFPMLWDYAVDRSMFSDRRAQFVAKSSDRLGLYTADTQTPYEGFFADLCAIAKIVADCGGHPEIERLLREKTEAVRAGGGYGIATTPSFMTLLQSECTSDVEAVRSFSKTIV